MKKSYVHISSDASKGISALEKRRAAYSDAVRIDVPEYNLLYVSGVIGNKGDSLISRNMREQAQQALTNLEVLIEHEGGRISDVVRFRIFVSAIVSASIRDVHEARLEFFAQDELPASTLVQIEDYVFDGALIEIEADVVMAPRGV